MNKVFPKIYWSYQNGDYKEYIVWIYWYYWLYSNGFYDETLHNTIENLIKFHWLDKKRIVIYKKLREFKQVEEFENILKKSL